MLLFVKLLSRYAAEGKYGDIYIIAPYHDTFDVVSPNKDYNCTGFETLADAKAYCQNLEDTN